MATLGPDFRIVTKLGEGSFAEVFKVKSTRTGQFYAAKRLKEQCRRVDEVNQLAEVTTLQGHPTVIDLVDLTYDTTSKRHSFWSPNC
jgi:serine/threonine protein kinase